jgi:hypothetical protein
MDYRFEDKIAAMELLRANGFNVSRTTEALKKRGLNVCRQTLAAWRRDPDVGGEVFKIPEAKPPLALLAPPKPYSDAEVASGGIYSYVREAGYALSIAVREAARRIEAGSVSNSELCSLMSVLNDVANSQPRGDEGGEGILSLILSAQEQAAGG